MHFIEMEIFAASVNHCDLFKWDLFIYLFLVKNWLKGVKQKYKTTSEVSIGNRSNVSAATPYLVIWWSSPDVGKNLTFREAPLNKKWHEV